MAIMTWTYKISGSLTLAAIGLSLFLLAIDLEPAATFLAVAGYILLTVTVGLRFFVR